MTAERRAEYDAFMSYGRELDGKLAPAFQRELERFAKPWHRLRSLRVFRDDANLAANPGLWSSIETAMDASAWFVLMASPEAARSSWVRREVAWWLKNRSSEHLLIVLTEGAVVWDESDRDFDWEASTALPQELGGAFDEEPRWVDLRGLRAREHIVTARPEFRDGVADVAAAIRGEPKDELIGEHLRQHRRATRLARAGATALVLLLIATTVAAYVALNEERAADRQAQVALSRQLAAAAVNDLDVNPSRAMLLSVEADRVSDTASARNALLTAVQRRPGMIFEDPGPVAGQALSSDGHLLAVAVNGGVIVWDVRTRQHVGQALTVPGEQLVDVAFSPDGRLLAAANTSLQYGDDQMGMVFLWDVRTRREVARLPQRRLFPVSEIGLAFSPDSSLLAVAADNGAVTLWNLQTMQPAAAPFAGDAPVAFSGNGRVLASADPGNPTTVDFNTPRDLRIGLWDVQQHISLGTVVAQGVRYESVTSGLAGVLSLALSPDGALLAAGTEDHFVRLWSTSTHELVQPAFDDHDQGSVNSVAFSPNGSLLASGGDDGTIVLRYRARAADGAANGTADYAYLGPLVGHNGPVGPVAFSADGTLIASGSDDRTSMLWDTRTLGRLWSLLGTVQLGQNLTELSPRRDVIAVVDDATGAVRIEDLRSGRVLSVLSIGNAWKVISLTFSPDDRMVAVGSNDGRVQVWDWRSSKLIDEFAWGGSSAVIGSLVFSPDSSLLAVASEAIGVRDVQHRRFLGLRLPSSSRAVGFSPDGLLVAGGALWDPRTGHAVGPSLPVGSVAAFSPSGNLVALDGPDNSIVLWNLVTHTQEGEPMAGQHDYRVSDAAFSPDGSLLATSSDDRTIRLWDVATQQAIGAPLSGYAQDSPGIEFTNAGKSLVSIGAYGSQLSIVQWDTDIASWRTRACVAAGRNLDLAEWQRSMGMQRPYRRSCPQYPAGANAPRDAPVDG